MLIRRAIVNCMLWLVLHSFSAGRAGAQTESDTIFAKCTSALAEGRVVDNLNTAFASNPTGEFLLAPQNGNLRYAVLIYNIDIYPEKAVFSAGIAFKEPRSNQLLAFKAEQVAFFNQTGLTGPAKLHLLQNVHTSLGKTADITFFGGNTHTWAVMDCSGLSEFAIHGEANFSPGYFYKLDNQYNIQPDSAVAADFRAVAKDWDNLLINMSLPAFGLKGLGGFGFEITDVVLDLSEQYNAQSMRFPNAYADRVPQTHRDLWEGFYLKKGKVIFPEHFTKGTQRPEIGVEQLLVDDWGISGLIYGSNLLSLEKGNLGGWMVSIDKVSIELLWNGIQGAGLEGQLGLPILPDTQTLGYSAWIGMNDNYFFSVKTEQKLTVPAFKIATLNLEEYSWISANINKGTVILKTSLSGDLSMSKKGSDGQSFGYTGIAFQGLRVSNISPKLEIDYLGLGNQTEQGNVNQFPVSLTAIRWKNNGDEYGISYNLGLHLQDKISARSGMTIYAQLETLNNKDKLVFRKIQIDDIEVDAQVSNIRLYGKIAFIRQDATYGDGAIGEVIFNTGIQPSAISGNCKVLFGNTNGMRYWYFDAELIMSQGIPVVPGLEINGFLGGAWQKMRALQPGENPPSKTYGISSTGRTYIPDANGTFGLRAGIYFKGPSQGSYDGMGALEMQYSASFGISNVILYGGLNLMTAGTKPTDDAIKNGVKQICVSSNQSAFVNSYLPKGKVAGAIQLTLDFANSAYYGNAGLFVNASEAGVGIRGIGSNGLAGSIMMYFSPSDWFVYAGVPTKPMGLSANIDPLAAAKVESYFMTGTKVLAIGQLPQKIQYYTGIIEPKDSRNTDNLIHGKSFVFGGKMEVQAGAELKQKNLALYAKAICLTGFDINMEKIPSTLGCNDMNSTPGIDGWFSNGTAYGALEIKIGGRYKGFNIDLVNIGAGAVMDMEGPNPFYGKGVVGLKINLIITTLDANMKFEFGKRCELVQTKLADSSIIVRITPQCNAQNVSTLLSPVIDFALSVNTPFNDNQGNLLRFGVTKLELTNAKGSAPKGSWIFNKQNNQAEYNLIEALPPKSNLIVSVQIWLQQWNKQKSIWENKYVNKVAINETVNCSFTTGNAPTTIPISNIAYAWPYPGQVNFHAKQTKLGFIQLKLDQKDLFNIAGTEIVAIFTPLGGGTTLEAAVSYSLSILNFSIPTLVSNKLYRFRIVRRSKTKNTGIAIGGSTNNSATLVLSDYWFRNSHYNTANEKISAFTTRNAIHSMPSSKSDCVSSEFSNSVHEYFHQFEINKLWQPISNIQQLNWFQNEAGKKIYTLYGMLPTDVRAAISFGRDTSIFGFIPTKAFQIEQIKIQSAEIPVNPYTTNFAFSDKNITLRYYGFGTMHQDLDYLKSGILQYLNLLSSSKLNQILNALTIATTTTAVPPTLPVTSSPAPITLATITSSTPTGFTLPIASSGSIFTPVKPSKAASSVSVKNQIISKLEKLQLADLPKPTLFTTQWLYNLPGRSANKLSANNQFSIQ